MSRRVVFLVAAALLVAMPSGPAHGNSGLFAPYVAYPTGSKSEAVAIGDVDGDGMDDVVVTTSRYFDPENDYHIHVFLQDGSGGLEPPVRYPAGNGMSVDIGDLDNDGRNDVVTTVDDGIGVFLQNDHGGLDAMLAYSGTAAGYKLRVGDLNSDGLLDVVSIDWGGHSHNVDVFLQNRKGTLDAPATYQVAHGGWDDLEVGDVDDNGRDDVIVSSGQGGYHNLGVLLQGPDGSFLPPVYYDLPVIEATTGIALGDLNGDALRDIAATYGGNSPTSFVATFLQNASGTLDSAVSYPSYDIPEPLEAADINSDGRDDVVVAHGGWRRIGVYLQNRGGTLDPEELCPVPYASHYNRHGLALGDINGDGGPDIAIAEFGHGLVVLYHTPPDCLFQDDRGDGTRLSVWGENWTFTGPGGFAASGTGARRHGDRVIVAGRHGDVVVSGTGLCPSGPGHFRAVELDPPRRKFRLVDSG